MFISSGLFFHDWPVFSMKRIDICQPKNYKFNTCNHYNLPAEKFYRISPRCRYQTADDHTQSNSIIINNNKNNNHNNSNYYYNNSCGNNNNKQKLIKLIFQQSWRIFRWFKIKTFFDWPFKFFDKGCWNWNATKRIRNSKIMRWTLFCGTGHH